jgi:hypothetical protein
MHPHAGFADEVGMVIFDLEVVGGGNRGSMPGIMSLLEPCKSLGFRE